MSDRNHFSLLTSRRVSKACVSVQDITLAGEPIVGGNLCRSVDQGMEGRRAICRLVDFEGSQLLEWAVWIKIQGYLYTYPMLMLGPSLLLIQLISLYALVLVSFKVGQVIRGHYIGGRNIKDIRIYLTCELNESSPYRTIQPSYVELNRASYIMEDNHRSSSSSSSSHNHNHMHQRPAEHDGTPANNCTLTTLGTPSDRHLKRSCSSAGFDHDPSGSGSGSTVLIYINEPDQHQHHRTPSRMPVRPLVAPSSSSISAFSSISCHLSSSVLSPSLSSHPSVPLSSLHRSPPLPTHLNPTPLMSQSPQRGPETDPEEDPHSPSPSPGVHSKPNIPVGTDTPTPNTLTPSHPPHLRQLGTPRSVGQRLRRRVDGTVSGPCRQPGTATSVETVVAAGEKRSRTNSLPDSSELLKRPRPSPTLTPTASPSFNPITPLASTTSEPLVSPAQLASHTRQDPETSRRRRGARQSVSADSSAPGYSVNTDSNATELSFNGPTPTPVVMEVTRATEQIPVEATQIAEQTPFEAAQASEQIPVETTQATEHTPVESAQAIELLPIDASQTTQAMPAPVLQTTGHRSLQSGNYEAPATPPITHDTLARIDARNELRNEAFLHDLLYADVPITSPRRVIREPIDNGDARLSGAAVAVPAQVVSVANKHQLDHMYWKSVEIEMTTGCRCTRWQVTSDCHPVNPVITRCDPLPGCFCGRWMPESSDQHWREVVQASPWPSRFFIMIDRKFKKSSALLTLKVCSRYRPASNHSRSDG